MYIIWFGLSSSALLRHRRVLNVNEINEQQNPFSHKTGRRLGSNIDDRRLHDGNHLLVASRVCPDLSCANSEKLAGTLHSSDSQEPFANRRANEINFELSCQNIALGWRFGQCCVAACTVHNACDCSGVHITVLLAKLFGKRQFDLHFSVSNGDEPCSERPHEAL